MYEYILERHINDRDWAIRFTDESVEDGGFNFSEVRYIEVNEQGLPPEFSEDWEVVEGSEIEEALDQELHYDNDASTYQEVIDGLYVDSIITWQYGDRDPVKVEVAP